MAYTYTTINGQRVQSNVAAAFNNLNAAFRNAFGLSLLVSSGTRTTAEQRDIFLSRFRAQTSGNGPYNDVRWYGGVRYVRVSSAGTVAVPGTSNHEEGGPIGPRALDIRDSGNNAGVTSAGNARSNWIRANAARYGFNPAGYGFGEPWHIEYTGSLSGGSGGGGNTGGSWPANAKYGAAWVVAIQQKLIRLGYDLAPDGADGKDGPKTQRAVSDFQGKHGLSVDGIAGPDTNTKLDAVLAGGSGGLVVDGQLGAATVSALQKRLGVAVDGKLGPDTIKALQTWLGISADGEIGPQTVSALQKAVGAPIDGKLGPDTISAMQRSLNSGGFAPHTGTPNPPNPQPDAPLDIDGNWGPATTKALQKNLGVNQDGEMGPITWTALQSKTGQTQDGQKGPKTIKALQMNVGAGVDGQVGPETVKKMQEFLNAGKTFVPVVVPEDKPVITYPKPAAPTYPAATWWNHSPNSSPRRDGDKVQYFVVHHAADTRPVEEQRDRFMKANDRNVSPNWLIGKDGSISEIVPPDKFRAWTSGEFDYNAVTVETQNTSGDPTWGISEESHIAIAKLVAWASKRYGFPIDRQHVIGHREVPGAATACPGPSMDLEKIVQYAITFANPVVPEPEPTDEWVIKLPKEEAEAAGLMLTEHIGLLTELRKLYP